MKKTRAKSLALVIAAALPGMSALSCSTAVLQEFRDAAILGATSVVQTVTADWLSSLIPTIAEE